MGAMKDLMIDRMNAETEDSINQEVAEDLWKQIKWLLLKNKTFIIAYLLEKVVGEKLFEHHGFKRLWEKYEKSKIK
jgi:hypothetical protein